MLFDVFPLAASKRFTTPLHVRRRAKSLAKCDGSLLQRALYLVHSNLLLALQPTVPAKRPQKTWNSFSLVKLIRLSPSLPCFRRQLNFCTTFSSRSKAKGEKAQQISLIRRYKAIPTFVLTCQSATLVHHISSLQFQNQKEVFCGSDQYSCLNLPKTLLARRFI